MINSPCAPSISYISSTLASSVTFSRRVSSQNRYLKHDHKSIDNKSTCRLAQVPLSMSLASATVLELVTWPSSSNTMVVSSAAIFQLLELRVAVCKSTIEIRACSLTKDDISFAFVEYESRRDADDAYHEMHNKRIGRDDVLKIEVRREQTRHQIMNLY